MFAKAPDDILDYEWDWSVWLPADDTIKTVEFTADSGITIQSSPAPSSTGTTATVWLSGGTAGQNYTITCQITTTGGRTAQNTQTLGVVDL